MKNIIIDGVILGSLLATVLLIMPGIFDNLTGGVIL